LGEKAPIGLLLAAVDALKFGFGALLGTFWPTFLITGNHMRNKDWVTFRQCLAPLLPKNLATLVSSAFAFFLAFFRT